MKKTLNQFLPALLAVVMLFMLAACGKSESANEETPASVIETGGTESSETTEIEEETAGPEDSAESKDTEGPEEPEETAVPNENIARPSTSGALHVEGTQLTDSHGDAVQLRGVSTHGLAWFPEYVNHECVEEISDWGANLFRLAMYTAESGGYCTDGDPEQLKDLVRQGVEYATEADMYAIVDWHILSEGSPAVYQSEAEDFFDGMSKEFAGQDNVLYEICNEPNTADWATVKAYAEDIIPIIRDNDPDAVIIVGTPTWSQDVDAAAADPITGYDNIMYSLHFYAATHKDDLMNKMVAAEDAGLPIFCTEFGICDASGNGTIDIDSANAWVALMNQYNVSYAMWNLSNKDESSSMISAGVTRTSGFDYDDLSTSGKWLYDVLQAAAHGTSVEDATAGLEEELEEEQAAYTITQDGISIYPVLDSSWESEDGYYCLYRATVTNSGDTAIDTWSVTLDFNEEIRISDFWNSTCTVNGSTLTVSSVDYNGALNAGDQAEDIGFIIVGTSALALN